MQELNSQDAEYLFSALPMLFLVSMFVIGSGLFWLSARRSSSEHSSGLSDAAENAGPNRVVGGHPSDVSPQSLPLKERLQALEGFLDENPPEAQPPAPSELPPETESPEKSDLVGTYPSDTSGEDSSPSDSDSLEAKKEAQLKSVVHQLKQRLE